MYFRILFLRKPYARITISRNCESAAPGRALASTWQNQLPVRDCQKRCIAETLVKLSGTPLQKNQAKSKDPPWESLNHRNYRAGDALECLNHRNYRAVASPTTRRDLGVSPLTPRALRVPERQMLRLPTFRRSELRDTPIRGFASCLRLCLTLP